MNKLNLEELTDHLVEKFNQIEPQFITETGVTKVDVTGLDLKELDWLQVASHPTMELSEFINRKEEAINEIVTNLKTEFTRVIKEHNFKEITNITAIRYDKPEKLKLGWIIFFMAK